MRPAERMKGQVLRRVLEPIIEGWTNFVCIFKYCIYHAGSEPKILTSKMFLT
jgi:hypothetical protein